jgi:hypothetical protein
MKKKLILVIFCILGVGFYQANLAMPQEDKDEEKNIIITKQEIKKNLLNNKIYIPHTAKEEKRIKEIILNFKEKDKLKVLKRYLAASYHYLKETVSKTKVNIIKQLTLNALNAANLVYSCAAEYPELCKEAKDLKLISERKMKKFES